jgi:hypothetical protein
MLVQGRSLLHAKEKMVYCPRKSRGMLVQGRSLLHAKEKMVYCPRKSHSRVTGPAIALPDAGHGLIPILRGTTNLTPQQVLARDILNLRNYTNAPNSSLEGLIELNKQMYPGAFGK